MLPIDDMILRISTYAPLAVNTVNYRIVDNMDGASGASNPEIADWNAGVIGLTAPTRAQLEAIVLPTVGTRFEARLDSFLLRRDDDALILQGLFRLWAKGVVPTGLADGLAKLKAEIKNNILDV